ncbi:MAG: hypothetical protein J0H19_11175 [Rhodospirillales bacterium]|nr:hypothetical protein [Rhodospirillales bacterium]
MKNPRTPGIGISGAQTSSLGGEQFELLRDSGFRSNDFLARRAAELDRQADIQLAYGRHLAAERLAHHAAELRAGGAA